MEVYIQFGLPLIQTILDTVHFELINVSNQTEIQLGTLSVFWRFLGQGIVNRLRATFHYLLVETKWTIECLAKYVKVP